jgi:hypothetical protein
MIAMREALGTFARNSRPSHDRNLRADRGRTIRYHAGRIVRGEIPRNFLGNTEVAKLAQRALHEAFGHEQAPSKAVADDAGQSPKAAENWWAAENPPGLTAFVNLYRNNARFAAFARYYLLGHTENDPILEIQLHSAMANMADAAAQLGAPARQFAAAMGFAFGNPIIHEIIAGQSSTGGGASNSASDAEGAGEEVEPFTRDLFEGAR